MHVRIEGDIRPPWFAKLEEVIKEASENGWVVRGDIVFEGYPYIFAGEPHMSKWIWEAPECAN